MFCTLSWCLIFWGFIHRKTMKFNIFINIFLISPGDIHFWIYDDVTDNSILDLQRKISICNAFAPPLFCFLSNPVRPRVICKGPSQEHVKQRKMACVSAKQRKICRTWCKQLWFSRILKGVVFEFLQISGV